MKKIPSASRRAMGDERLRTLMPTNGVRKAAAKQSTVNHNRQLDELRQRNVDNLASRGRRGIERSFEDAYLDAARKRDTERRQNNRR